MTPEQQIILLKLIIAELSEIKHDKGSNCYICNIYYYIDRRNLEIASGKRSNSEDCEWKNRETKLSTEVPLFTLKNAKQFGAKEPDMMQDGGWWVSNEFEKRIAFLNWIIEQLEK